MEQQLLNLAKAYLPIIQIGEGTGVAGGNTRRMNFEYQAFVFALRRTLEYFAVSVGAFFKHDVHRIRKLVYTISGAEPRDISERVSLVLEESLRKLSDILPPDNKDLYETSLLTGELLMRAYLTLLVLMVLAGL